MTTSALKPLTTAEQIFKDLVWNPGVKAGELALEGAVPFLSLPIIKSVDEQIINLICDHFFNQFILLIDLNTIKLVNKEHQAAYDAASLNLALIAQEKGLTSDEYAQAREAAKLDLSRFVRNGGQ